MQVIHHPNEYTFELKLDGHTATLKYRIQGDALEFWHTSVPDTIEGRGVASQLVRVALSYAREKSLKVIPACAFVRGYFDRHPEEGDLLL